MEQAKFRTCAICGVKIKIPATFKAPRGRCPRCGELIGNPFWNTFPKKHVPFLIRCIRYLGPNYDELSAFLTSGAFILTILANSSQILAFLEFIESSSPISPVSTTVIMIHPATAIPFWAFVLGMVFSFYHVFSKRVKKPFEKAMMAFFIVTINVVTGIAAGFYMLGQKSLADKWWLYIFPTWTFINSAIIWLKFSSCKDASDLIEDENASLGEVVFGLFVLLTVFSCCHFVFKLEWAFTLSICVVYATSFSKSFGNVFLGKKGLEQSVGADDK